MNFSFLRTLRKGFAEVLAHPQLWLTVVVAIAIIGSFAYVADRFIRIARDAQDRLVNVRVGALQDSFAPLAAAFINNTTTLQTYMQGIAENNPTITEFDVIKQVDGKWNVIDSISEKRQGTTVLGQDFFLSLAIADPRNSFTVEEVNSGTRYFRTARAIVDASSSVIAVALTKQSLSEADRSIASSIQSSIIVLIIIVLLLLFLFFHHARIIDYTALYNRLKEVDNLKDDFISLASHELRAPLTVIRALVAELTEGKLVERPEAKAILEKVDHSAQNLNTLVGDMLDVARIEQGRMPLTMETIDPSLLISEVCDAARPLAQKNGISIALETVPHAHISADTARLRQVLNNLVSNSIKYSDKGEITVRLGSENDKVSIRVSDTGIGMTAEEVSKLFGKFQRATGERVRGEVGTGLGLWITKQLVEAMNGNISVESIKGVGSHFVVTFPVAKV